MHHHDTIRAIQWVDGRLRLLDQRLLPNEERYNDYGTAEEVADAIQTMVVRGAPAIGITAAFGIVLAARARFAEAGSDWQRLIPLDLDRLAASRPTAVNLFWAIKRMGSLIEGLDGTDPVPRLLAEAERIHDEDVAANYRMGELGAALIEEGKGDLLTHCNTGSLATGGFGTALGVIRAAFAQRKFERVYADETRPWLQGARLTAWELVQERIPVTLLADGAAAHLMRQGKIQWVIVGADRIAANGDTANKIGTYQAAVAARYHGVRFMVVAPTSTVDLSLPDGAGIPIENRSPEEVLQLAGRRVAAAGAEAWNPAFDVTPAELIDAIVTERGVVLRPTADKMASMMKNR